MIDLSYVYILSCNDNTLYTGWTVDLNNRIATHNNGKGAKYTRGRTPVKLVYFEKHENRVQAQKREYEIKQLSRFKKLQLIKSFNNKFIK